MHLVRTRLGLTLIGLLTALVASPLADAATPPKVVSITVKQGRPVGGISRTTVKKGTVVRYVIRVDRGESVHLHGYDLERAVRPGKALVLQFPAKIPGRFELELHHPDALIAQLSVKP